MKKILSLLLAILIAFSSATLATDAATAEIFAVKITGRYYQTQARELLNTVNAFRTGSNTWVWDKANEYHVYYKGLTALTYDYDLEKIAMQRAAELAAYYAVDHTRSDGTSWETAHTVYNPASGVSIGENIFSVTKSTAVQSAEEAFDSWLEEDMPYEYQGHRRNMLSVSYPFVTTALACFEVDETFYWVELFRSQCISSTKTSVSTAKTDVVVDLNENFVKGFEWTQNHTDLVMQIGQSTELWPTADISSTSYKLTDGSTLYIPVEMAVKPRLKSSDPTIVSVSGNVLSARGAGSCTITCTGFMGKTLNYQVYVDKIDLSSAVITLSQPQDTYIYTGSVIMPDITSITLGGVALRGVVDYEVTYGENTQIGNGVVYITGVGNYTGAAAKSFKIIDAASCTHLLVIDPAVDGNCVMPGKTAGSHCSICGKVFVVQQSTGLGNHVEVITGASDPTCTQDGNTGTVKCSACNTTLRRAETIPALGHNYPEAPVTKKATLSKNGSVSYVCSRCGDAPADKNKVIFYPKTFTLSKAAFTYNGKAQKPKLTIKDAAGNAISSANYSASIPGGKYVGRYTITVKFKGNSYEGTKTLYYDIIPKNTSKLTVSAAKKAFKAKWTTQKVQTTGYQLQYSAYSNFKSAKTFTLKSPKYASATVSKLSAGKKYYVRMRTYKTVKYKGKSINLYSAWYKTLAVKTK